MAFAFIASCAVPAQVRPSGAQNALETDFGPTELDGATAGVGYYAHFTANGGAAPYVYTIVAGELPPGLVLSESGSLYGVPSTTGSYGFIIACTDAAARIASRQYTLTVGSSPITALDDAAEMPANTSLSIPVMDNDSGSISGLDVVVPPSHGTAVVMQRASNAGRLDISYTPARGHEGTDSFSYVAYGPGGRSQSARVDVVVKPFPQPVSRTVQLTDIVEPIEIDLTTDAQGGPFTGAQIVDVSPSQAGQAQIVNAGSAYRLRFAPAPGLTEKAIVTFRLSNAYYTSSAAATVTFLPDGHEPLRFTQTALPDTYAGDTYRHSLTVTGGVPPYRFEVSSGRLPPEVALYPATGLLLGPPMEAGTFTFTVRVNDALQQTAEREYTVAVAPQAPIIATNDIVGLPSNVGVHTIAVAGNDQGNITGLAVVTLPSHGAAVVGPPVRGSAAPTIVYTPTADYLGPDSFRYVATGPAGQSQPATVTLTVNTFPVAQPKVMRTSPGVPVEIELTDGAMGGPFTRAEVQTWQRPDGIGAPAGAGYFTIVDSNPGFRLRYNAQSDFSGAFRVTYTLNNGAYTSQPAVVDIEVGTYMPPPMAISDGGYSAPQGGAQALSNLLDNDSGAITSIEIHRQPTVGTVDASMFSVDRKVVYFAPGDYVGPVSFEYVAVGPGGRSTPATVSLLVKPVPRATPKVYFLEGDGQEADIDLAEGATGGPILSGFLVDMTPANAGQVRFSGTHMHFKASAGFQGMARIRFALWNGDYQSVPEVVTFIAEAPEFGIATSRLPRANANTPYDNNIVAVGSSGPYTFALVSDSGPTLPSAFTLDANGRLHGMPTDMDRGTYTFTVEAFDAAGHRVAKTLQLDVWPQGVTGAIDDNVVVPMNATTQIYPVANDSVGFYVSLDVARVPAHGNVTRAPPSGDTPYRPVFYTPSAGYTGNDSFDYSVTGSPIGGGWTVYDQATVHITVVGVPVATAHALQVEAGATGEVDIVQGATQGPFTGASVVDVAPANAGSASVVFDAGVYKLRFRAGDQFTGSAQVHYTLSNAYFTSEPATVNVAVGPATVPKARTVDAVAGVPASVDLNEAGGGGEYVSAALVSLSPGNAGAARIVRQDSGERVRHLLEFTASTAFSGEATTEFVLTDAQGVSHSGTIVFRVFPRPDPTNDADLRGLIEAQTRTAQRFADVQIDNFARRLERLHGQSGDSGFDNGLNIQSAGLRCEQQVGALPGTSCHASFAKQMESRDRRDNAAPFGVWAAGTLRSGDFDARFGRAALDFETEGVSLGADRRFGKSWMMGGGLGYARDRTWVGDRRSRSDARAYTLAGYAGYAPGDSFFVDAVLGYQWLHYDLHRSGAFGEFDARRRGRQWFASLTMGARVGEGDWSLTPYGRLDGQHGTLDAYKEGGPAAFALAYAPQSLHGFSANFGLRVDYRILLRGNALRPQLRFEYQHDFSETEGAELAYADGFGLRYRTSRVIGDRSRFEYGLGARYEMRQRWSVELFMRGTLEDAGDDRSLNMQVSRTF